MIKAKRGRQCLSSGSRLTGGSHASTEEELVEKDESRTSGSFTIRRGDESD